MTGLTLEGTVKQLPPQAKGVSKSGNEWVKQDVIVEYDEGSARPKTVKLTLLNRKVDDILPRLRVGARMRFGLDIESREHNGRWYTDCTVWKAEPAEQQPYQPQPQATYDQPAQYGQRPDASWPDAWAQPQSQGGDVPFM